LRKEETSAIVTSDEKLDRRERRDRAKECRGACSRRHRQPERVAQGGRRILIWICHNPL